MAVPERLRVADQDGTDLARRWTLLGIACSLAFERFILIYRKYSENQPRDERGRWVDAGGIREPETTGALRPVRNDRTGDPLIDEITDRLNEVLSDVEDELGPGMGTAYGQLFHYRFADAVRDLRIPDVHVEVSIAGGVLVPYASEGSIRTDVQLRSYTDGIFSTKAIWDVKTGGAYISGSRAEEIRSKIGLTRDVPIIEMSVRSGITNKEISCAVA